MEGKPRVFEHRHPAIPHGTVCGFLIIEITKTTIQVSASGSHFLPYRRDGSLGPELILKTETIFVVERPGLVGGIVFECGSLAEAQEWIELIEEYQSKDNALQEEIRRLGLDLSEDDQVQSGRRFRR